VFLNPETGLPYHPRILSWWVPALCRAAGVPVIQPKDMRATCASNLLSDGVPLPTVSQLLGHSSIAVTSAFYERIIKRRQAQIAQVADSLDAALDRSAESARGTRPAPIRRAE
jgi:integrase